MSKFYKRNPNAKVIEQLIKSMVSNPKLIYYHAVTNEFVCYDNSINPIIITKLSPQDFFNDYDVNSNRW